jgi:MFS family permease
MGSDRHTGSEGTATPSPMSLAHTTTSPSERPAVSAGFTALYALAVFGTFLALLTPPVMTLALRVAEVAPDRKESVLSLALGLGALISLLVNPIAGLLSDRTTSRFGMRRPWILGGLVVGIFGLYLIASGGVAMVVVGWCVTQFGFNFLIPTLLAVLPDQVPERQHGRVSGILNAGFPVGVVAGVFTAQAVAPDMLAMFLVPGVVAAVLVVVFVLCLDDRRLSPEAVAPLDWKGFLGGFWISPRTAPDFAWAWLSRFLLFMGLATLMSYQVFYLLEKVGIAPAGIPEAMLKSTLVSTLTTVAGSVLGGWLSDRLARRRVFVLVSAVLYGLGLAIIGASAQFDAFLWGIAVCGLGQGVYLAVDLALVAEVLPDKSGGAAKGIGIISLANNLPQSIAPAIAPVFLAFGAAGAGRNYTVLFVVAAIFALLGALAAVPIKGVK